MKKVLIGCINNNLKIGKEKIYFSSELPST